MSKRDELEDTLDPAALGALLASVVPVPPPPALKAKILQRVRADAAPATPSRFVTQRATAGWRSLLPGIEVKLLGVDVAAGTKSFLLRAAPGARLPSHPHTADEECLVLEGEFSMDDLTLGSGDYHFAASGTVHPESHTRDGVLVYLRAGINDYPGI
jgi:putative transcriptional regulator